MSGPYDDIINLQHPSSPLHPKMSMAARAAQFSPFKALIGHDDAIAETARLTEAHIELTEDAKGILDTKLQTLLADIENQPMATVTYFQPDPRKEGGSYITIEGNIKKIDNLAKMVVFTNGDKISIEAVFEIQIHGKEKNSDV